MIEMAGRMMKDYYEDIVSKHTVRREAKVEAISDTGGATEAEGN